ncbi:hypothetical protein EV174_003966 [Coemansia sp. RSA 2320]|nr:hypothetical protein EV174_003966 [Coemansia sp. RSA 2320]
MALQSGLHKPDDPTGASTAALAAPAGSAPAPVVYPPPPSIGQVVYAFITGILAIASNMLRGYLLLPPS